MSYYERKTIIVGVSKDNKNNQESGNVEDVTCRHCDGRGEKPERIDGQTRKVKKWEKRACYVCDGRGKVRLKFPDSPTNCGQCQGTGRELAVAQPIFPKDKSMKCRRCGGIGMLSMSGRIQIWKRPISANDEQWVDIW